MKRLIFFASILVLLTFLYIIYKNSNAANINNNTPKISEVLLPTDSSDIPLATIIAEGLEVPWGIVFLPDGGMLVTERVGRVRMIDSDFTLRTNPVLTLEVVRKIQGEGGLHGITLHPEFQSNKFVYIYYTYESEGNQTLNRVERFTFDGEALISDKIIIDNIPGSLFHDGGRIKFGPDNLLYVTTGDAQNPDLAQNTSSLAGKILRITDEGEIPSDNPFGNPVYSYGHRNPQGIAWDAGGNLWSTEHGRSGVLSGLDEVNFIESGKNYGWPEIEGDEANTGMVSPARHSGASNTWAPACAAITENMLFFSGLKGEALYATLIDQNHATGLKEYFKGEYGRIRECIVSPDGMLYITTSNRDGRGKIQDGDDKIIRINPKKL
jgi:aldose sugar dehydrogenase